jgi:hypothetical protein
MAYEYYVGCIEDTSVEANEDLIETIKDSLEVEIKDFHIVGFTLICDSDTVIELNSCSSIKVIPFENNYKVELDNKAVWINKIKFLLSTNIIAMNYFYEGVLVEDEPIGD